MSNRVRYEAKDRVARITMDDAKVNVMSVAMMKALNDALDRAEREAASLIVIRSSRPGIFSAGFDLKVFAANDAKQSAEMVRIGAELALRLMSFPMPTIGVMEGHAFPMGAFLLLACDVRIAARGPYRIGLNEVAIRITPPAFAIELARSRLHPAWLNRTVTLGEMYEPDDALAAGFLDKVVQADVLEATLNDVVAALKDIHLPSHISAKRQLRAVTMASMKAAIEAEVTAAACDAHAASPA
jgi:enoyl-CoA hydratase